MAILALHLSYQGTGFQVSDSKSIGTCLKKGAKAKPTIRVRFAKFRIAGSFKGAKWRRLGHPNMHNRLCCRSLTATLTPVPLRTEAKPFNRSGAGLRQRREDLS
jgi:hypothetical protein